MIGAIIGDIVGSPYEFGPKCKSKNFPLFGSHSVFTDDSVMTIAIAVGLIRSWKKSDEEIKKALVTAMQSWGKYYNDAGYGEMFQAWLHTKDPKPYYSYGNGSAMRVSSVGWLYDTLEETRHIARLTAEVTHNHPEGIKGAECVASAIFLARTGKTKQEIKEFIESNFNYDLSRTCDEIRPTYEFNETCQKTVPEAIIAFLEGNNFEDVIRTAVSLGGDCDTLTCIAGSIAEAFYGISSDLQQKCFERISDKMQSVIDKFLQIKDNKFKTQKN